MRKWRRVQQKDTFKQEFRRPFCPKDQIHRLVEPRVLPKRLVTSGDSKI